MSAAYYICAIILLLLDTVTAVLLIVAMKRIYNTIRTYYPMWKTNRCFIALQAVTFTMPIIFVLFGILVYTP